MKAFIGALFGIALSSTVSGQTVTILTNADLNKPFTWKAPPATPEMLASLDRNQYRSVSSCQRCDGPYFASTGHQPANMSGPWDWPRPMPARRLDGTWLFNPPTVYGLPPYPYPQPFYTHSHSSAPAHSRHR